MGWGGARVGAGRKPGRPNFAAGSNRERNKAPEAVELLAAVLAELRGLRADLAAAREPRPSTVNRGDRVLLARMLPAIAGAYGSEVFSARDLTEDTRPAVRLVMDGLTAKQVGKLFSRADGIAIDGLMVQRAGVEFHVTSWRIVAC